MGWLIRCCVESISLIFTKLTSTMYYGTEMNTLNFWVKGHGGITYAGWKHFVLHAQPLS